MYACNLAYILPQLYPKPTLLIAHTKNCTFRYATKRNQKPSSLVHDMYLYSSQSCESLTLMYAFPMSDVCHLHCHNNQCSYITSFLFNIYIAFEKNNVHYSSSTSVCFQSSHNKAIVFPTKKHGLRISHFIRLIHILNYIVYVWHLSYCILKKWPPLFISNIVFPRLP